MPNTATSTKPNTKTKSQVGKAALIVAVVALVVAAGWRWDLRIAPVEAGPPGDGEVVAVEAITGPAGNMHARVAVAVVLVDGVDPSVIDDKQALLKDAVLQQIAVQDPTSLRSSAGSQLLRQELTAAAHEIWGEDQVAKVVLTELLLAK